MNPILNDKSWSIADRFEMSKILLQMKDTQIAKLEKQIDELRIEASWSQEQSGYLSENRSIM